MKLNTRKLNRKNGSGFTLLELLVTLIVLSIGLLGLGLMQTAGLGFTKTAYARTQAMMLASDIADRVRANENYAANYVGTSAPGTEFAVSERKCVGRQSRSKALRMAMAANFGELASKKTLAPDALNVAICESIVGSVSS